MNAIIGMSAVAFNYLDDKKRTADCLSKITFSSKHLLMLLNDVSVSYTHLVSAIAVSKISPSA